MNVYLYASIASSPNSCNALVMDGLNLLQPVKIYFRVLESRWYIALLKSWCYISAGDERLHAFVTDQRLEFTWTLDSRDTKNSDFIFLTSVSFVRWCWEYKLFVSTLKIHKRLLGAVPCFTLNAYMGFTKYKNPPRFLTRRLKFEYSERGLF